MYWAKNVLFSYTAIIKIDLFTQVSAGYARDAQILIKLYIIRF